jgi:RNA polymerase sigma factor (TIGR02999 family)
MVSASEQLHEVTRLLTEWCKGNEQALEKLTTLVYAELHRLAHRQMRQERPDHTLQTTALINEAYLRLVDIRNVPWQNRAQFFALCARLMRRILVDFARSRQFAKRGGGREAISLDESAAVSSERSPDLVAVHEALEALQKIDSRKAQVVELRFFGGLTADESAEVLKVSSKTIQRDWELARAWLLREISGAG